MINDIKVLMNPAILVLINFIKKTKFQEIRGLYDEEDFFFWDAERLIHDAMAPRLGIIRYTRIELRIFKDKLDIDILDNIIPEIEDNLYFQNFYKWT